MSCGPKAVSWMSPVASAVRASAKRWNITISILMSYLRRLLGQQPQRRQRGHVQHALLDRHRLRQRLAQVALREGGGGEGRGNDGDKQASGFMGIPLGWTGKSYP